MYSIELGTDKIQHPKYPSLPSLILWHQYGTVLQMGYHKFGRKLREYSMVVLHVKNILELNRERHVRKKIVKNWSVSGTSIS